MDDWQNGDINVPNTSMAENVISLVDDCGKSAAAITSSMPILDAMAGTSALVIVLCSRWGSGLGLGSISNELPGFDEGND